MSSPTSLIVQCGTPASAKSSTSSNLQQQQLPIRNSSSNRSATATATNPQQLQKPIRNSNTNQYTTATATAAATEVCRQKH
jgi:hypothetical protein